MKDYTLLIVQKRQVREQRLSAKNWVLKVRLGVHHAVLMVLSLFVTGVLWADEPIEVLFLGDQGHHQPAARFKQLASALEPRGVLLTYTENVDALNAQSLSSADALVIYANIDSITDSRAKSLLDYVADGGGLVPLHCASYCFRNNPEVVKLIGAQFQSHGTGIFRTLIAQPDHPVMRGFAGFESWDETYVHGQHNEQGRIVLEYRQHDQGNEPWTWVRSHGKGRVFYTAWGHDERTWGHPGFQNLVERGIRYVTGHDPGLAGLYQNDRPFIVPESTAMRTDVQPFSYTDVGNEIHNYVKSKKWGEQGQPLSQMQEPLSPEESLKHWVCPVGFRVELFVSEPDLQGKPICMNWDERGRLWVAETYDYPNELQPAGAGRDRIRICQDTDGDGRADKFTVFAEKLSIPTSLAFSRGGVIVQDGAQTIYLKDIDGDDVADQREVLISGWAMGDTHGGVSNFQYGLDNWIWAMQGYNASEPIALGKPQQPFRMGFMRIRPDGSEVEFIRSTNNNTWGLGISEEGLIFGSTANGCPSVFMPIPNRYYERVRGWTPSLTLSSIADSNRFLPITDKVRQVDHFGGYTAGAGHALYTARQFPQQYWNRVAVVSGPTGHLVGTFVLSQDGSGFQSTNPFNLLASDDQWSAPIMAEVGPDGCVWVIDWYNYIVQHNPTPHGFETGKGQAYETKLRDKRHGRIYRVVHEAGPLAPAADLSKASPLQLVEALRHPVMLVRKHAQRLLVERGKNDVILPLLELVNDRSYDAVGLNVGAIHALWVLHGLGQVHSKNVDVIKSVHAALKHPSPGVRRNAVQVLEPVAGSVDALTSAGLHLDRDANVRLAAVLALADLPATDRTANAVIQSLASSAPAPDRWIRDAATSAAASDGANFLIAVAGNAQWSESIGEVTRVVAGHYARSNPDGRLGNLLTALQSASPEAALAVVSGLADGWPSDRPVTLTQADQAILLTLVKRVEPSVRSTLVKLAVIWGSQDMTQAIGEIADELMRAVGDASKSDQQREQAAVQAVDFQPESQAVVQHLLDTLSPRLSPDLASAIVRALRASRVEELGQLLIERLAGLSPTTKTEVISLLLSRPTWTNALLESIQPGRLSLLDPSLEQRQSLAVYPDIQVRTAARKLMDAGGALPSADRQQVVASLSHIAHQKGNPMAGKQIFLKQCSKCHVHSSQGTQVGPDLTGMSVHPKEEMLVHILDPSRSVENNFRAYSVLTVDGLVLTGMLASESKTAIELFDTEGKKSSVLREDIEQLTASPKSIMPEGFEKSVTAEQLGDLLEFLAQRGRFVSLDLSKAATVASDRGMFVEPDGPETMIFQDWSPKEVQGVPFKLIDPQGGKVPNAVVLRSTAGVVARTMPLSVSTVCTGPVKTIHILGGVAGWGYPLGKDGEVSMIVRLTYSDGQTEDHPLLNGVHIADYIRRVDVPQSVFAFDLSGKQLRYLSVIPNRKDPLTMINLVKGTGQTAPVVMAMTIESYTD